MLLALQGVETGTLVLIFWGLWKIPLAGDPLGRPTCVEAAKHQVLGSSAMARGPLGAVLRLPSSDWAVPKRVPWRRR